MKKIFYLLCLLSACYCFGGITDLGKLCSEYFLIKNNLSDEQKDKFNEVISAGLNTKFLDYKNRKIKDKDWSRLVLKGFDFSYSRLYRINFKEACLSETIFFKTTFSKIDFSVVDLKNVRFIECHFIECNFKNSDLSKTDFKGSKFDNDTKLLLQGVLLYEGFRFDTNLSGVELVKQYSEFIVKAKEYEEQGDLLKANSFYEKAQGLNKLLGPLQLKLKEELISHTNCVTGESSKAKYSLTVFKGLDLTGVNLENADLFLYDLTDVILANANLRNANLCMVILNNTNLIDADLYGADLKRTNLKGVFLSENVWISANDNRNEWFEKWDRGLDKEKQAFQKLLNAGVPLLDGISNERLRQVDWKGLDLSYSDLRNVPWEGIHLEGVKLLGANMFWKSLKNLNLQGAHIGGLRISNFTLPNPCEDDDLLKMYKNPINQSNGIILKALIIARGIDLDRLSD